MSAIGQLQQEHAQLRRSLAVVDTTLHIGAPAWPILEEACVHLAAQLEQHVAREEPVRIHYTKRVGTQANTRKHATNHKGQARQLRGILRHLLVIKDVSPKDTDAVLGAIIEELGEQMETQEQQLFPAMERIQEAKPQQLVTAGLSHEPQ